MEEEMGGGPQPSLRESYEREDERWAVKYQVRDWLLLFILGAMHFTWMLIVFLFEPGIR